MSAYHIYDNTLNDQDKMADIMQSVVCGRLKTAAESWVDARQWHKGFLFAVFGNFVLLVACSFWQWNSGCALAIPAAVKYRSCARQ